MTSTDDLERRMADYYQNEAPARAPNWLLTRAIDTIEVTPQRRTAFNRPWRIAPLPSLAKLAAAAVALVTITVLGATVLQLPSSGPAAPASSVPSTSPSVPLPPPLTERFDSTLNGFSMAYPAGWQRRPATEAWRDGVIDFDAPGVDIIFDPARGELLYLAVASEPIGGRPHEVWREGLTLPCGPGGHSGGSRTFDGASGWVAICGGTQSALLTNGSHHYAIVLYTFDKKLVDTYDWGWFESVLETLDVHGVEEPGISPPSDYP
jgi:hypothetical protein